MLAYQPRATMNESVTFGAKEGVTLEKIRATNSTCALFGLGTELVRRCSCAHSHSYTSCNCAKLLDKIVAKDPGVVVQGGGSEGGMRLLSICTSSNMIKTLLKGERLWHTRILCRRTLQLAVARYKSVGREGREKLEPEAMFLLSLFEGLIAMHGSMREVISYL